MEEVPGSEKFFDAQLVFLALGFLGPEGGLIKSLGVKTDPRSNIQTPPKVCPFAVLLLIDSNRYGRNTPPTWKASLQREIAAVGNR
jgi:NADPH-dependent glutamate synthase beta subunit-like oxidoreductase